MIFLCIFFSVDFFIRLYMKKFQDFSVGYRTRCVHCQPLTTHVQLLLTFKLLFDNVLFPHLLVYYEQFGISFPCFFSFNFSSVSCIKQIVLIALYKTMVLCEAGTLFVTYMKRFILRFFYTRYSYILYMF